MVKLSAWLGNDDSELYNFLDGVIDKIENDRKPIYHRCCCCCVRVVSLGYHPSNRILIFVGDKAYRTIA